jgi:hypothetical protein
LTQPVQPGRQLFRLELPAEAPAGLYVPRLSLAGSRPLLPSGATRGLLFLRPVRLRGPLETARPPGEPALAVRPVEALVRDDSVELRLAWWTARPLAANYNVSLRLTDNSGRLLAQQDIQPGYGFHPSSLWPAGQWRHDWLSLPFAGTNIVEPAALSLRLYDIANGQVLLTRRLGQLIPEGQSFRLQPAQPQFTLPQGITPLAATFADIAALRGFTLAQEEMALRVTLYWEALQPGREELSHFVHLLDPVSGQIVAQHDAMPDNNTYPTSQWSAGEIIADRLSLDLTGVPPGRYDLVAGLYRLEANAFPRLAAVDEAGNRLPGDFVILQSDLEVGRPASQGE